MADGTVVGVATVAFGAGVATFFSPCAYALLPGYVGYYLAASEGGKGRSPLVGAALRGLAAVVGVIAVFAGIGLAVLVARPVVRPAIGVLEPVVGVALVAFGVAVLADRGPSWHVSLPARRESVLGFAVFGAVYAVAAAGCVAPFVLAIVAEALTLSAGGAFLVLAAYTVGFAGLLLSATVAIAVGRDALFGRLANRQTLLHRTAGAALVLAGIGQLVLLVTR
jgi:cytochrome c-type biogenesis protein